MVPHGCDFNVSGLLKLAEDGSIPDRKPKKKNHRLTHLKSHILGAAVLEQDIRELLQMYLFLDRLISPLCFIASLLRIQHTAKAVLITAQK